MFDQSTALRDTVVMDDPDAPPSETSKSVPLDEEEYVPHLIIEGERHKMALDHTRASCGAEFHAGLTPFIEVATWKDGKILLCTECFPKYERDIAAQHQAEEKRKSGEYEPINIREWLNAPAGNPKRKK